MTERIWIYSDLLVNFLWPISSAGQRWEAQGSLYYSLTTVLSGSSLRPVPIESRKSRREREINEWTFHILPYPHQVLRSISGDTLQVDSAIYRCKQGPKEIVIGLPKPLHGISSVCLLSTCCDSSKVLLWNNWYFYLKHFICVVNLRKKMHFFRIF